MQTVGNDQSVFVLDGHHVRDRTDRDEVGVLVADAAYRRLLGDAVVRRLKGAEQLKDHADTRKLLEGIVAVGTAGIDDRRCAGQIAVTFVVAKSLLSWEGF